MNGEVGQTLKHYFGHDTLRPGQAEVIERVLSGVNALAVLPTGGGKSLCYQLPALMLDGLTVVVSPLIALMRDQVDVLLGRGIEVVRVDSSATEKEVEIAYQKISDGVLKLLYVSPERLADPALLGLLRSQKVSLVAIDEAHCISEWGHSFRPAYMTLPRIVRSLKPGAVLALTATASKLAARGIRKAFKILQRDHIQTSFYRHNLSFHVTVCRTEEKRERLIELLRGEGRFPSIVYAMKRGDVEELAAFLTDNGVSSRAYHAGMPSDVRAEVQDGFLQGRFPVICATIAFGMGVDMPHVRSVVHFHPPKSPEGWIQESGRAGRDGEGSHCELLLNGDDQFMLESMVVARQPSARAVEAILQHVFSQGRQVIVSRYNLSTLHDVSTELLDVMFARLEMAGWITPVGGSWMWCHIVPLRWDAAARSRLLSGFSKQDQVVLRKFIDAKRRVSLLDMADHQVAKMHRLVRLLRELEAAGEVRLKMSHSLVHYRIKKFPEHVSDLVDVMQGAFREHADYDLARIAAVFQMAISRKCIAASLVGYFGEQLERPCGHCTSCLGTARPRKLPETLVDGISEEELESIQSVVAEKRPALSSPERLARFLCGIYSPAMMRYRLYNHPHWGMLERLNFEDVLLVARLQ